MYSHPSQQRKGEKSSNLKKTPKNKTNKKVKDIYNENYKALEEKKYRRQKMERGMGMTGHICNPS
jgi:hypothetical protein